MHSPENDKPTDTTECYPFSTLLLQSEKVQVSVYYKLQKYCSDSSGCNTSSKVGNQIGFSMSHATEILHSVSGATEAAAARAVPSFSLGLSNMASTMPVSEWYSTLTMPILTVHMPRLTRTPSMLPTSPSSVTPMGVVPATANSALPAPLDSRLLMPEVILLELVTSSAGSPSRGVRNFGRCSTTKGASDPFSWTRNSPAAMMTTSATPRLHSCDSSASKAVAPL